ncbi:MAG: (2Fe-2S)-binding protein [Sphingomicrobium sp.]
MAKLTVNGEAIEYRLDPAMPLLWALRDSSNLTGTKYGCDTRDCGACTVIIDGQAVMSCSVTLGELEGVAVTTIEGLSATGKHPLQQAWIAEGATMCGFCEPGFILAAAALIDSGRVTDAAAIAALPNICGCGGLVRIRRAIERAARGSSQVKTPPSPPIAQPGTSSPLSLGSSDEQHIRPD